MENLFDINIINIAVGSILLVLSAVMFMIPIQRTERWRNFRIGRGTLASAYLVLGLLMVVNGIVGSGGGGELSGMITLIIALFQALLFTRICVLFLKPHSFDGLHYRALLTMCTIISIGLAASYVIGLDIFKWVFGAGMIMYTMLLAYCSMAFTKNYNEALKHLEYIYDEDMYYCMRWVKRCFYSALLVGVMAWFMAVFYNSEGLNIAGIFLFTIYYLCMVGYFMRYVSDYGFILKSDIGETASAITQSGERKEDTAVMTPDMRLAARLEEWVREKKYHDCTKKIDEIVDELGTTRVNLNDYTNRRYGMNFRAWRNRLRVEEAKVLLEQGQVPLSEIYSAVGFTDRSNFHREFKEIVGETPNQYRTNHCR